MGQKGGIATKMDKLVTGTCLGELGMSIWDMVRTLEKPHQAAVYSCLEP